MFIHETKNDHNTNKIYIQHFPKKLKKGKGVHIS